MTRKLVATFALVAMMAAMPMIGMTTRSAQAQDDEIKIAYILHGLNDFTADDQGGRRGCRRGPRRDRRRLR